jgi:hypothetical protein
MPMVMVYAGAGNVEEGRGVWNTGVSQAMVCFVFMTELGSIVNRKKLYYSAGMTKHIGSP